LIHIEKQLQNNDNEEKKLEYSAMTATKTMLVQSREKEVDKD
jgi:hypothetical protein